jgi:hypothetical protein
MAEGVGGRSAASTAQAGEMLIWTTGSKWHIESSRFIIGKAKMPPGYRVPYRYTLADGQRLVGCYDSAEDAKVAAENCK